MNRTTALAPVLLIAAGVALAGCTAAPDTAGPPSADTITVVASTTVYGDLAATIGGDAVEVTSIIDDPNKDPHEPSTPRTTLAVCRGSPPSSTTTPLPVSGSTTSASRG